MKMTKPFWYKVDAAKRVAETLMLSRAERGTYSDLYNALFINGGFLPDNDQRLANITGCTLDEWREVRPAMESMFVIDERGWHHPDLLSEMLETAEQCGMFAMARILRYGEEFYENSEILRRTKGKSCTYCGDTKGPFEIDHIHPFSRGGTGAMDNLAIACRVCNREKGARMPVEWLHDLNQEWTN